MTPKPESETDVAPPEPADPRTVDDIRTRLDFYAAQYGWTQANSEFVKDAEFLLLTLVAVEAERDSARDACLEWDAICKGVRAERDRAVSAESIAQQTMDMLLGERNGAIADAATLRAERDRLKAALQRARQDFGMVACDGSTAGIAAARVDAALTPQGQSTDGETR